MDAMPGPIDLQIWKNNYHNNKFQHKANYKYNNLVCNLIKKKYENKSNIQSNNLDFSYLQFFRQHRLFLI